MLNRFFLPFSIPNDVHNHQDGGAIMNVSTNQRTSNLRGVCFSFFVIVFSSLFLLSCLFFLSPQPRVVGFAVGKPLASYTTYYNPDDKGRSSNIQLACKRIHGVTVQPYGEFSFNKTVGKRTRSAGFQDAKIIIDGEFVIGVGGGVCQVSTTLYNAALLAGLKITESHPHSLSVSYVPPSRDAMVSSESDFSFFNPLSAPIRLTATAADGVLKISIFGENDGGRYEIISYVTQEIPPPEPIIRAGNEDKIVRREKQGIKSEAYLEKYVGNALIARKRLRKDTYAPVQGIIVKKMP